MENKYRPPDISEYLYIDIKKPQTVFSSFGNDMSIDLNLNIA